MAQARAVFDLDTVRSMAAMGCSIEEIAAYCGHSGRALKRNRVIDPALEEAWQEGHDAVKARVRLKQFEILNETYTGRDGKQRATRNAMTMSIWLGKQILGQREKIESAGEDGGPMQHALVVKFVDSPQHTNGHAASATKLLEAGEESVTI